MSENDHSEDWGDNWIAELVAQSIKDHKVQYKQALEGGALRVKLAVSDPIGTARWEIGDIGIILVNDYSDKYDLKLLLPSGLVLYFYYSEVETHAL